MTEAQNLRLQQIPDSYKNNYIKAISGKSKAAAIKARCLDCCCWQKIQIPICGVQDCPLYPYRPYQNSAFAARMLNTDLAAKENELRVQKDE